MGDGKEGEGRLRIGPWVPDPVQASRSVGSSVRVSEPVSGDADADTARSDVPSTLGGDVAGRRMRRRIARNRRRRLVVTAIVAGLGVVAVVPLLRSSPPARPTAPALPQSSSAVGLPPVVPSDSMSESPMPSASPSSSPPPAAASPTAAGVPAPRPAPVTYEAEAPGNEVAGTATVDYYPGSSGGLIVRNIGNWRGARKIGALRFNGVIAPATGTYLLTFFYLHLDDEPVRTAVISVSDGAPVTVSVTGSSTCCRSARLRVTLQRGANTVTFTNPTDHAPSIDRIVISAA